MAELSMRFPGFRTKALTLSYDDGTVFDRQMVPILNRYGLKCTFNLNSKLFKRDRRIAEHEVNELYTGHEIAVHTATHPHLENLDCGVAVNEIIKDREELERISGVIVKGMAYPFGLFDKRITQSALACGIHYARTVQSTHSFDLPHNFLMWHPTCHHDDDKIDELIAEFFEEDDLQHPWRIKTKVFYLWGHSYEFENRFNQLVELCEKISGSPAVWYATNGDIFDYVDAYKRMRFSANGELVYNPSSIDLYAYANGTNVLIPAGKTVNVASSLPA